ncbi:hypothetical protein [Ectobacillus antri]|uniref:hypothetical protein n=1 Tax=Ectobacillus antri TaxID=2486280 RepID=UPI000F59D50F|nr:hypothetical protein [Ectobacillus antri]
MIGSIKKYMLSTRVLPEDIDRAVELHNYIAYCCARQFKSADIANEVEADKQFKFYQLEQLQAEMQLLELEKKRKEHERTAELLEDLVKRGLQGVANVIMEAQGRGQCETKLQLLTLEEVR